MKTHKTSEQLIVDEELHQEEENQQLQQSMLLSSFNSTDEEDEQETSTTEPSEDENQESENKKKTKSYIIPSNFTDLVGMSKRILEVWRTKPELVLLWMPIEDFETKLEEFEKAGDDKSDNKTKRSPVVSQLKKLDYEIDYNLTYLKQHISIKFGKEHREAYYPDFGIEYQKNKYVLPFDRQERIKSLEKMVAALNHYEMNSIEYGLEYWTNIKNKYSELLNKNLELTQGVSMEAGKKSELKKQVKDTIAALQNLIKVQYRDQSHFVLREFGYLREHF